MERLTAILPTWASNLLATTSTSCLILTTGSAIVLFTLIGTKNLPLAYTFRLLPSLYRLLKPRYSSTRPTSSLPSTPSSGTAPSDSSNLLAAHPSLFTHHVTTTRCYLPEIDINVHKSNSTFFTDADVSRAALLTSLLSNGLSNLPFPSSPNKRGKSGNNGMFLLSAVSAKFLRPVAPLERYEVSSRILSWENGSTGRALYTVTYFLRPGTSKKLGSEVGRQLEVEGGPAALIRDEKLKRGVFAVLVSRYVFKAGRESLSPETVLKASGLLSDDKAGKFEEGAGEWIDGEKVQRAVGNGLEYVKSCMM
ncbi:hypothetical protein V8F20_010099 [Naviculisporaceae sp. PSN 640]